MTSALTTHQSITVDVGPLNLLGFSVSFNHGTAQNIQILLQRRMKEGLFICSMHIRVITTRGHSLPERDEMKCVTVVDLRLPEC